MLKYFTPRHSNRTPKNSNCRRHGVNIINLPVCQTQIVEYLDRLSVDAFMSVEMSESAALEEIVSRNRAHVLSATDLELWLRPKHLLHALLSFTKSLVSSRLKPCGVFYLNVLKVLRRTGVCSAFAKRGLENIE